jgi:flagellar FliL protein
MAEEESNEESGKKKKPLLIIIIAANVLVVGGAAAYFMGKDSGEAKAATAAADGAEGGGHGSDADGGNVPASGAGPIVPFDAMVVNLNEPEGARYLKIQIAVQLTNAKMTSVVEESKAIITDHFIRELSDLNHRQTMGNKNKLAIKRRLLKRLNEAVGTDAAVDIHLTTFIVQ